jgi:hypothetical protein
MNFTYFQVCIFFAEIRQLEKVIKIIHSLKYNNWK